ncbi:MAG: type II toxin-antitoxin system VapC family toxin [Lacipirellulaceae bacterium]
MSTVFADTGFFVALVNPRDALHASALRFAGDTTRDLLTTELVVVELGNFLRRPSQRTLFLEVERELRIDPSCEVRPGTESLIQRAIELFAERPDKQWSLTDCASFIVMQDHGVTEALTGDHHFEQAGFVALLRG